MRISAVLLAALLAVSAPVATSAQENNDLERIPDNPQGGAPEPKQSKPGRLYLENALTASSLRGGLIVPFPPPSPPDWQNRTSLDAFNEWTLGEHLSATLSDRFNVLAQDGVTFPSSQSFRNDFRE